MDPYLLGVVVIFSLLAQTSATLDKEVTCQKVVAQFSGTFNNGVEPTTTAQFEFTVSTENENTYIATIDNWNETLTPSKDFGVRIGDKTCPIGAACTLSGKVSAGIYFGLSLMRKNDWMLFWKTSFSGNLQLAKTDGHCTNLLNRPANDDLKDFIPDQFLYNGCWCCENYIPNASLNCPASSIIITTTESTTTEPTSTQITSIKPEAINTPTESASSSFDFGFILLFITLLLTLI